METFDPHVNPKTCSAGLMQKAAAVNSYEIQFFLLDYDKGIVSCSKCDVPYGPEQLIQIKPDTNLHKSSHEKAAEKDGGSASSDTDTEQISSVEVNR